MTTCKEASDNGYPCERSSRWHLWHVVSKREGGRIFWLHWRDLFGISR
jgi:hypothetical protein